MDTQGHIHEEDWLVSADGHIRSDSTDNPLFKYTQDTHNQRVDLRIVRQSIAKPFKAIANRMKKEKK